MTLKLTIELSDRDLRHLRRELTRSREAVRIADDEEIIAVAAEIVDRLRETELPDFVTKRLQKLQVLQAMLTDAEWPLDDDERYPVLAALAYLCDPEDIIPDDVPGIGLLDDAVMIELVFLELRHQIQAYEDFCAFRWSLPKRPRDADAQARRLERRRGQLMARMRRRRAAGKR